MVILGIMLYMHTSVATIQDLYHDIRRFVTFYHDNIAIYVVRNGTVIRFNPNIPYEYQVFI